jgi:hypothetical protein
VLALQSEGPGLDSRVARPPRSYFSVEVGSKEGHKKLTQTVLYCLAVAAFAFFIKLSVPIIFFLVEIKSHDIFFYGEFQNC